MSTEPQLPDMMNEITEAILAGRDVEAIRTRYGIHSHDSDELVALVKQLNATLVEVQPDNDFSRQLKQELLGEPQAATWLRVRSWPARVQVAAVAAVAGTFMLLLQRRFFGVPDTEAKQDQNTAREKA